MKLIKFILLFSINSLYSLIEEQKQQINTLNEQCLLLNSNNQIKNDIENEKYFTFCWFLSSALLFSFFFRKILEEELNKSKSEIKILLNERIELIENEKEMLDQHCQTDHNEYDRYEKFVERIFNNIQKFILKKSHLFNDKNNDQDINEYLEKFFLIIENQEKQIDYYKNDFLKYEITLEDKNNFIEEQLNKINDLEEYNSHLLKNYQSQNQIDQQM